MYQEHPTRHAPPRPDTSPATRHPATTFAAAVGRAGRRALTAVSPSRRVARGAVSALAVLGLAGVTGGTVLAATSGVAAAQWVTGLFCTPPSGSYQVGTTAPDACSDIATGNPATQTIDSSSTPGACHFLQLTDGYELEFDAPGSCIVTYSYPGDQPATFTWNVSLLPPPWHGDGVLWPAGVQAAQGCVPMPSGTVVGMAATHSDGGYWIADQAGQVDACGGASIAYGELSTAPASPIVSIEATADGGGYWLVGSDGAVYAFGDAGYYGSLAALPASEQPGVPVVGMAASADGKGYWEVTGGGDIYSFGDAVFHGSTGNIRLNKPVVGMALDPQTGGYWLDASDGGIFAFDAPFRGSMGGTPLNKPVVGMAPDLATGGYWLVAADGGIFSFGAPFYGSTGNLTLAKPIVGMEAAPSGAGYRFVATDGGIFCFGSSLFYGSAA